MLRLRAGLPGRLHRTLPAFLCPQASDRYRLMALRTGERVRLLTRNGNDWSEFFPASVMAPTVRREAEEDWGKRR